MNDNRPAYYLADYKLIGKEGHDGSAVVREQHGKVSGVVPVGLVRGIPVFTRRDKRGGRVPRLTDSKLMDVKAVGPDRRLTVLCGAIRRESGNVDGYPRSTRYIGKAYNPADLRGKRAAAYHGRSLPWAGWRLPYWHIHPEHLTKVFHIVSSLYEIMGLNDNEKAGK